jgi:hypothetical protein
MPTRARTSTSRGGLILSVGASPLCATAATSRPSPVSSNASCTSTGAQSGTERPVAHETRRVPTIGAPQEPGRSRRPLTNAEQRASRNQARGLRELRVERRGADEEHDAHVRHRDVKETKRRGTSAEKSETSTVPAKSGSSHHEDPTEGEGVQFMEPSEGKMQETLSSVSDGRTRPIGVPSFEDKVLQRAVAMVLARSRRAAPLPRRAGDRRSDPSCDRQVVEGWCAREWCSDASGRRHTSGRRVGTRLVS